jgi:hypothetical protein
MANIFDTRTVDQHAGEVLNHTLPFAPEKPITSVSLQKRRITESDYQGLSISLVILERRKNAQQPFNFSLQPTYLH